MIAEELYGPPAARGAPADAGSAPDTGKRVLKRIYNTAFKMPVRSAKPTSRK